MGDEGENSLAHNFESASVVDEACRGRRAQAKRLKLYSAGFTVGMLHAVTEERIRVRYGETDQMGHAYYANYLFWFEQARGAWCRDRGFTYKGLEDQGVLLPVVEAHLRYRGEVKYDDWIVVRIWVSEIKRSSMKFEYEVFNETSGKVVTEGYTWHVVMSPETRSAVSIPPFMRELMERNPASFERVL